MAKQQFKHNKRRAVWEAYDRKCAHCRVPIPIGKGYEIDHVIPDNLLEKPEELSILLSSYSLQMDFDLTGNLNLLAACADCNGKKHGTQYPPGQAIILLGIASSKAAKIDELLQKYKDEHVDNTDLAKIGTAVEEGRMSMETVLAVFPLPIRPEDDAVPMVDEVSAEVLRVFGNASQSLMNWPQKTNGHWIYRQEIEQLKAPITEEKHSFTVLLGSLGSGKSALLANLASELKDEGVALIALKADLLPKEIGTLAQLDEELRLDLSLIESLKQLAATRPVVLLVDQVDALAELMDQKTARLTVLCRLINGLREVDDLHIILSCRDFEYRHDLRINTMNAKSVNLSDPPWAAILPVLASAGINATNWPTDAQELLRRPQYLNLFSQYLVGDGEVQVFTTYHSMLEAVLRKRVTEASTMDALETLADAMSEEEELWLPAARFQNQQSDIDRLVAIDFLKYSDNLLRIGFRHQTIYDFVRARAFTRKGNLTEHVMARQDALFVRPTLWSALNYLREADRNSYHREFQKLWDRPDLRRHIRYLLVEFRGQVPDPDPQEVAWLPPILQDPPIRAKALKAMVGNKAWFYKLSPHLPTLMAGDDIAANHASWIIEGALTFDRDAALKFMECNWFPDSNRDGLILLSMWQLKVWDERAIWLTEQVMRRSLLYRGIFLRQIWGHACESCPNLAPRLVAAELWKLLENAESTAQKVPPTPPPEDAPAGEQIKYWNLLNDSAPYAKIEEIVSDSSSWNGLSRLAALAPKPFVDSVWPWLLHVAGKYVSDNNEDIQKYRYDPIVRISRDMGGKTIHITEALGVAIDAFATASPEEFLSFLEEQQKSELLVVHRLLARALVAAMPHYANVGADYLLADVRRLALGPRYSVDAKDTIDLIKAIVPHLGNEKRLELERYILSYCYILPDPNVGVLDRRRNRVDNQHRRLLFLRAFPTECLSSSAAKILEEADRAVPRVLNSAPDESNGIAIMVPSPISKEQMEKASDEDLINLFDELHDGTGYDHPTRFLKGGRLQVSNVLGEFAKANQQRVLQLLNKFQPGKHESYAAQVLRSLSEGGPIEASSLVVAIQNLDARNFQSDEFREGAAWSFCKMASNTEGLDANTCELLEGWLKNQAVPEVLSESPSGEKRENSILLGLNGGGIYPSGNYPILRALFHGYLNRKPMDANGWLSVLERHLNRQESPRVWRCLCHHELTFLVHTDKERAIRFTERLVETQPAILDSIGMVGFIARARDWINPSLTHRLLEHWESGTWVDGPQAAAEIAMLRYALIQNDRYCKNLVERILNSARNDEKYESMRLGVTFLAAEVWRIPKSRALATNILKRLLPLRDESITKAWLSVLHSHPLQVDIHTQAILDTLINNPELLRHADSHYFLDRLKELLETSSECQRVCKVVTKLLIECGEEIADSRTAWFANAGDLMNIALTLQRLPETRACGLDLFEHLMDLDPYQSSQTLGELDRRIAN